MSEKVKPNLFIIGAMKSGSTSLHEYLSVHPDIYLSDPKEPGYFVDEMDYYPKDEDWYLSIMAAGKGCRYVGESSTHYTKLPTYAGVVEKIHAYSPGAKLIYIMRDPVKRAISHYWHNVRKEGEHRTLLDALKEVEEYVAYSDYGFQIAPYERVFGRENIYLLTFEQLIKDPDHTVREVLQWLGLDVSDEFEVVPEKHNAMPESFTKVKGRGLLYRIRHSTVWGLVSPLVPKSLKNRAISLSEEAADVQSVDTDAAVEYLRPIFRNKQAKLEKLFGREITEWKTIK